MAAAGDVSTLAALEAALSAVALNARAAAALVSGVDADIAAVGGPGGSGAPTK